MTLTRLAADENFNNNVLRGLQLAKPNLDIVRLQDTDLLGADDPTILEWAAMEGRILLTHDVDTLIGYAYERITQGLPLVGVLEVRMSRPPGQLIEDILIMLECFTVEDWQNQIKYVPL